MVSTAAAHDPKGSSRAAAGTPDRAMAHVLSRFPCLSETFVESDIQGMTTVWPRPVLFAFTRGPGAIPEWVAAVHFARPGRMHLRSQLRFLRTRPGDYLRLLATLIRGYARDPLELLKVLYAWPAMVHMADLAVRERVDGVHAHWANLPATAALVMTTLLDRPYLFSAHAFDIHLRRTFLDEKLRRARRCFTCTESNRRHLLASHPTIPPERIVVCRHGVDTDHFRPGNPPATAPPLVLATVGRATWQKGFPTLLRAVAACQRDGIDVRLVMLILPGPLATRLRALVDSLGIAPRVRWEPVRTPGDMPALYRSAHAFVLPCEIGPDGERDGIPNVLAEAMASGLPVVTTPVGGIPEIVVDDHTGLLVPPRDPEALARTIRRLASDPALRERLGNAARAHMIAEFSRHACRGHLIASVREVYAPDAELPLSARTSESGNSMPVAPVRIGSEGAPGR